MDPKDQAPESGIFRRRWSSSGGPPAELPASWASGHLIRAKGGRISACEAIAHLCGLFEVVFDGSLFFGPKKKEM